MIVKLFPWYLLYAIVHDTCINIEDQKILCLIYRYALSKHTLGFSTLNQFQTAQYIYFAIKRKFELNYPRRTHNRHFKKIDPDITTMINGMLHIQFMPFTCACCHRCPTCCFSLVYLISYLGGDLPMYNGVSGNYDVII